MAKRPRKSGRKPSAVEIKDAAAAQAEATNRELFQQGLPADAGPSLTGAALAEYLDLTHARVSQLGNQGVLPRNDDGSYPQNHARVAYIRFIRRAALVSVKRKGAGDQFQDARVQKIQIDIAEKQGLLVPVEDVEAIFTSAASSFRAELTGISASVTRDLQLRAAIDEKINDAIDRVRATLEASAEAAFSDSEDDVEGEEATP